MRSNLSLCLNNLLMCEKIKSEFIIRQIQIKKYIIPSPEFAQIFTTTHTGLMCVSLSRFLLSNICIFLTPNLIKPSNKYSFRSNPLFVGLLGDRGEWGVFDGVLWGCARKMLLKLSMTNSFIEIKLNLSNLKWGFFCYYYGNLWWLFVC